MTNNIIGVSGINATDNPGPGCGVANSLLQNSQLTKVIGLSYDVNDPGNYIPNLLSNSFLMPYPNKGWEEMKSSLCNVQKKTGLNFLIPCLDIELPLMIKYQNQLTDMGIKTLLPTEEQFNLRAKDLLQELAKEINCHYPKTKIAYNISELTEILKNEITFPAVIKGKYYSSYIVYDLANAVFKATEIAAQWGYPILVQEKIDGQELNVIGISNYDGELRGSVSVKKQLTTPLGKLWTAISICDKKLTEICHNFAKITKWKGPFELECIVNNNQIYLIEINPRFPSWVYFATSLGINMPQMLLEIIEKKDCQENFDYPSGKIFIRYPAEFVTDLEKFQNLISHKNRNGL